MIEQKLVFAFKTQQEIIQKIGQIDRFAGKWSLIEQSDSRILNKLRNETMVQNIGASTRIEGANLSNLDIEALVHHKLTPNLASVSQQIVNGYFDAYAWVLEDYESFPLTEDNLFLLHRILMKYIRSPQIEKGRYKSNQNHVMATFGDGRQQILFKTSDPERAGMEMRNILRWMDAVVEGQKIHPLLLIAVVVYEFLAIYPFQEGNGRMSRLLTHLLLLRSGYRFIQYLSLDSLIEQDKKHYFQSLVQSQKLRHEGKDQLEIWILYFFNLLVQLCTELDAIYETEKEDAVYLNGRQREILLYVEENQPVKIGDINQFFTKTSRNTIKKDLQYLVAEKCLKKSGQGRGTRYEVIPA